MKTITVSELRQNPTAALKDVEAGETYVVTRHRRPVARLVPPEIESVLFAAPTSPGPTRLTARPRRRSHDETESLLAEMASDW